jgi:Mrp family chromosome partitioning ATPase
LSEARDRYDLILLDSAPLLMSSQTRIISTRTDGVIIVAEANGTRWEVLREIKRQLEADHAKIVGGILNKRRFVIPRWAYRFI